MDRGSVMKKGGRATGTRGPDGKSIIKAEGCFTNTAVPRFNGGGCWQQHLQIVQAIVKSNGWMDGMAALQLEALNVALLMPEEERAKWEGLSQCLSHYYNSSGRLAVFRRQFESTTRRSGMDPATFATELEILAVRGFGDMGKRARDWMVRDRFIAAQRSCRLHQHLDGVSSDTPIRNIVDRCHVWENHSEQKESSPCVGLDQDPLGGSGDSREPGCLRSDSQELMVCPVTESRVPVHVASVSQDEVGIQRKVGNGDSQLAPLEVISSLVTRLLRAAQEDWPADVKVPPEEELGLSSAIPTVGGAEKGPVRERVRVCFSCGRPGHGVNRCSQMDTSFPFLSQGWSVDVRGGQYRAIRTGGTGMWPTPGDEGWSGREGQPPGSSGPRYD